MMPSDGADDDREQRREERDQQRDPRAVDDAAEHVAAVDRLEPEQEVPADAAERARRRAEHRIDQLLVELVGRVPEQLHDQRREDRHQDQQDHHDAAGHGDLVPRSRIQAICLSDRPRIRLGRGALGIGGGGEVLTDERADGVGRDGRRFGRKSHCRTAPLAREHQRSTPGGDAGLLHQR